MFFRFNRYLPVVLILIFIIGCKMSSTSTTLDNDENKVKVNLLGSKKTGIQIKN